MTEPRPLSHLGLSVGDATALADGDTLAFTVGDGISARLARHPLANPVVIAAGFLILVLAGPAPPTRPISRARSSSTSCSAPPPSRSACRSGATAPASAATSCRCARRWSPARSPRSSPPSPSPGPSARRAILASLAAKSVTAPIAMALTESIGGIPALAAVLVVLTGILGSVIVTPLMNALGIKRLCRPRLRRQRGQPRHRHRPGLPGQRGGRHLRGHRHGPERRADRACVPSCCPWSSDASVALDACRRAA